MATGERSILDVGPDPLRKYTSSLTGPIWFPLPRLCLKASATAIRATFLWTSHPFLTTVDTHTSHFCLCHTLTYTQTHAESGHLLITEWQRVSGESSGARISRLCHLCWTHYPLPLPPLPTWLCTSSCPRHKILCNCLLRKPHCIRLVVRKCLLLLDRAGATRGEVGGKGFICVESSHFPECRHLSLFLWKARQRSTAASQSL